MNDMRLIDADALIEEMQGSKYKVNNGAYARGANAVIDYYCREIPFRAIIDAVPVVRCKDCKYVKAHKAYDGRLVCGATTNPNWVSADHFCSYGERKDGD